MALSASGASTEAERLAKEAEKAERAGQVVEAYLLYARAAAADSRNPLYWTKAQSLRAPASMLSERKLPALGQPIDETAQPVQDASGIIGTFTRRELEDMDRMTPVPHLRPVPGKKDFHLRGDAKTLFEQLALQYGYAVIFDKDYNAPLTVRFDVTEVDYKGALHALEQTTNSFIVPLSEWVMLVAQDTTQKRTELEANEALGIPIPQRTSVQEAQELSMMVQQTLELRRVVMDPVKRMIYIRDRASKVELASAILSQLSGSKPQVSVEVEFLSVGRSSSMSFGLTMPTQFPLVNFGSVLRSSPSIPAGFMRFLTFGAGKTFLGMGITDAQLFATASRSDATSLLKSEITASDGLPAILHVGDKYPIQTGAYIGSGGLGGSGGVSTTYATISTASYADVAITNVSTTGKMKIAVNGREFPFTIPAGANSMIGVQNIVNSLRLGVNAVTIPRGTPDRPYSLLVVASTLGISSIQLYDDPDGANIKLLKTPDVISAISLKQYPNHTGTRVSSTGTLSLELGSKTYSLALADVTNNLEGLRDAINHAGANLTASILSTGIDPNPFYLQVVADQANSGSIQVFDDPAGAHTAMFAETNEVSQGNGTFGKQVLTPATNFGQTFTPPPTFNFEDLGLVLKITPFVHDQDEVTLEVEAEFKVLGTGSYNGVPVISTRKFQGKLRLRTSEYAVVAGLMSDTQARSISGLAGLSQIPVLGVLLRDNERTHDTSQVLIVIKPRVTSMPPGESVTRTFWFGSEMKPLTIL